MVCLSKYFGDSLLFSTWQYYAIVGLYLLSLFTIKYYDNPYFFIWFVYSFVPLMDEFLSMDIRNPTKEESKQMECQLRFKLPLYVTLFTDWLMTLFLLNYVTTKPDLNLFQYVGCLFVAGNFAAVNINISHELMHKSNAVDQLFGMITLSKNLYMHFFIEHVQGHHKHVATPHDPATSKLNQTYYEFLPQTLIGSLRSAWNCEKKRLLEIKKVKSVWVIQNRMLYFGLNNLILPMIIYNFWGFIGALFFVGQAAIGIALLEVINYIEHYGLQRKEISPGVYEKVNIHHSWNTPHRFSNYLLFKLQRHSDHHENGYKPYQILTTFDESPQLPHGYTVCLLLATVPSVWFKIMNEYVLNFNLKKPITEEMNKRIHREIVKLISMVFAGNTFLMALGFMI